MKNIKVPFADFTREYEVLLPVFQKKLADVMRSGVVMTGSNLWEFENSYAKFSHTKYAAGIGNGLDALTLALEALHIGPGDEVIVPTNTYIATVISISRTGAIPVFVEPKIETYNIDPNLIEAKISKRTKAIMPVHLYGQACEMSEIMRIAEKHKIMVIEDNAQSQGATYNGKITGSWGIINATSFYPTKNLGALGDGGAITTNSKKLYEQVLMLRNYGSKKKYYNDIIGYNSRLDELQAAFLQVRLKRLLANERKRISIAKYYYKHLKSIGDVILPVIAGKATHVYHIFLIRTKKRNALQEYLKKNGIGTLIHYPVPPHLSKAYSYLGYKKGTFPIAEKLANTSLSLPMFPELTQKELDYVVAAIKKFFDNTSSTLG